MWFDKWFDKNILFILFMANYGCGFTVGFLVAFYLLG
jgi:hypothetical protein